MMELVRSALRLLRNPSQRKHFLRWLASFQNDYFLTRRQPWLVFDVIDFLNCLPLEGKRVFEYGSGGSTLYWLSRQMLCVSVEHDPGWYDLVRVRVGAAADIDYRLVQPEKNGLRETMDIADPMSYLSDDIAFRGYSFKNYASQIDAFPPDYFDLVVVDGRARPACILHSVSKVKVNGLLILDNADRQYYTTKTAEYLGNFDCSSFYGVGPAGYQMWRTNVYLRGK